MISLLSLLKKDAGWNGFRPWLFCCSWNNRSLLHTQRRRTATGRIIQGHCASDNMASVLPYIVHPSLQQPYRKTDVGRLVTSDYTQQRTYTMKPGSRYQDVCVYADYPVPWVTSPHVRGDWTEAGDGDTRLPSPVLLLWLSMSPSVYAVIIIIILFSPWL